MQARAILRRPVKPVLARRGMLFLVALLLALASALVPALMPSGATPSRYPGSAFDPSSTVLSLRGREQQTAMAIALQDERDASLADGASPGDRAAAPQLMAVRVSAHPASGLSRADPALNALPRLRSPAQPRAPPPLQS